MTSNNLDKLVAQLKHVSEKLSVAPASDLSSAKAKSIRKALSDAEEKIRNAAESLDPIKHPGFVFDPSNPNVVGRIVGLTLIAQPRKPLETIGRFYGSGVYAIYYNGDFPGYAALSKREHPIYVGKADPANPAAKSAKDQGDRLARRLNDHRKNIGKASGTLRIEDFEYRALVVQTGWQTSAEDYLIHLFKPIWNSEIGISYGFGKHGDDPGTRANLRSPWDTLHPGRDWAHRDPKMKDAKARDAILDSISAHLASNPPVHTIDELMRRFLNEMRDVT